MEDLAHIIYVDKESGTVLYDLKLEEDTIPNLKNMRESFVQINKGIIDAIKSKVSPVLWNIANNSKKAGASTNALDSLDKKVKKEEHSRHVGNCPKEIFDPHPEDDQKRKEMDQEQDTEMTEKEIVGGDSG